MGSAYISPGLRRLVYERAGGRCEYCLIPASVVFANFEYDHIFSQKHGGKTHAGNLALCCTLCNKLKGSDLSSFDPITNEVVPFYRPRRHRWLDHFELHGAQITPVTAIGRATVQVLKLNLAARIQEREHLILAGIFKVPA